ncbi:MAG: cupredoxin domain-containing protein [Firmicutes bacterium]|nr:cupredoxin domain-containing protein [Bacillota bacterium]
MSSKMRLKRSALIPICILILGLSLIAIGMVSAETAPSGQKIVVLKLGSQKAAVDDQPMDLDAAPVIINGRTMVPIRFIAEALDVQVRWNADTQTVVVGPKGADLSDVTFPAAVSGVADDEYVANAADFVAAADWKQMETARVDLSEMAFTPKNLTFEAGKPYKLEIHNIGAVKHEFTAGQFYRSIALRKVQDDQGEFKLPYATEIEVFAGERTDLYFVPLIPGTYELVCEIPGHKEAGMFGTITVTGAAPSSPRIELGKVSTVTNVVDAEARVQAADWKSLQTVDIEVGEMYFKPQDVPLKVGVPYKLQLINKGTVKHEADAAEFFRTAAVRKAQDIMSEVKGPTFNEIEVFEGEQVDLYLIPTQAGTYELACRIPGHYEAGMHGTIVVEP